MQFDTFSVVMGLLLGSTMTLALHFLSRWDAFLQTFGIRTVLLLYLPCVMRIALPVKFPFTISVGVSAWNGLADLLDMSLPHTAWNVRELLGLIWLTGAVISLIKFLAREVRVSRHLRRYPGRQNALAESVLDKIRQTSPRRLSVQIVVYQGLSTPMGVGLFHSVICLPDKDYTAKELSYILRHEYAHFLGRDLHIKFLARLYVCLFWWNPAAWLLLGDIGQVLELRCDRAVTKHFTLRERREYLTVILRSIMEAESQKLSCSSSISTSLFAFRTQPEILERFRLVADPGETSTRQFTVPAIISVLLFAGSYAFMFRPTAVSNRFTIPDGIVEMLLLLAICGGAAVWSWRKSRRTVRLFQRRLGALVTAAAVLVAGLGVYQTGFQAGRSYVSVTATVTNWDGSRSSQIAIDMEHYDSLTSLDVHDVLCTSAALGKNPEGPYQFFPSVFLSDADTIIMAANRFEAVSAVPADSVEYELGFGPEFLMGDQALCGISEHYAQLTGLRMGDLVTMPIYTVSYYSYGETRYGEAYHRVGQQTLRVAAVYPYGQTEGARTPDMTVPTEWLREVAEGAGGSFCYSSLSAKLDNSRQAEQVWGAGFVPVGTGNSLHRYSNTVTIST